MGGSSGAVVWAAIDYCVKNDIPAGKRVVIFAPDSIRNYLSTFVSDSWMID